MDQFVGGTGCSCPGKNDDVFRSPTLVVTNGQFGVCGLRYDLSGFLSKGRGLVATQGMVIVGVPVKWKHVALYEIFYSLVATGGGGPIGVDQGFVAEGCRVRSTTNELTAVG